jgi:hypothetical protein
MKQKYKKHKISKKKFFHFTKKKGIIVEVTRYSVNVLVKSSIHRRLIEKNKNRVSKT